MRELDEVPEAVSNAGIFGESTKHLQSGLERLCSLNTEGCGICEKSHKEHMTLV